MIKNVLVKASGDVVNKARFFNFMLEKTNGNYVVLICGAGTKINEALQKAGYKIKFNDHGRETKTWEERMIARNVLEKEEKRLQDKFVGQGVVVMAPILYAGAVLCPINGDNMVKALHLGFDQVYVFTKKDRRKVKKKIFAGYPKIKIRGI